MSKFRIVGLILFWIFGLCGCNATQTAATIDGQPRPEVGGVKYRLLVDKVYVEGRDKQILLDEDYRRIYELGFNVICPRYNGDNFEIVKSNASLAMKNQLYSMVWLRGSLPANINKRAVNSENIFALPHEKQHGYKPVKYTLASGHEFDLLSPNSDELWDILGEYILGIAKLSTQYPIIGVFMDFENYARPLPKEWGGHLYAISYDEKIMSDFSKNEKMDIPELSPAEREIWLKKHNLLEKFQEFQIASWRKRMATLRAKIDKINPSFQFACYPSSYSLFVNEAVWKGLSTPKAPILAAEHYTYAKGFPNKDKNNEYWKISDKQGVELNRNFIRNCVNRYADRHVPFGVIGGMDPVEEHGKNPEFQGQSAVAMSQVGSGYWVFYEGVTKKSQQFYEFEKWFKWANKKISEMSCEK